MIFSKGSKLHIVDGDTKYTYLITGASLSQSIREASYSRNTIQLPNLVDQSFPDTFSPVSMNISLHLGKEDTYLLKWIGLTPKILGGFVVGFDIDYKNRQDLTQSPNVYLEASGAVYEVTQAVITNCSFQLGPKKVNSLTLTGQGSRLELIKSVPEAENTIIQSYSSFYSSAISVSGMDNIRGVTLEYTRDIRWLYSKGVHQINTITYPSKPVATRFSLAGTITKYTDQNDTLDLYDPNYTQYPIKFWDKHYEYDLKSCMVSYRYDTSSSVHTTQIDFKLNPNNASSINII